MTEWLNGHNNHSFLCHQVTMACFSCVFFLCSLIWKVTMTKMELCFIFIWGRVLIRTSWWDNVRIYKRISRAKKRKQRLVLKIWLYWAKTTELSKSLANSNHIIVCNPSLVFIFQQIFYNVWRTCLYPVSIHMFLFSVIWIFLAGYRVLLCSSIIVSLLCVTHHSCK